jgi:putative oxidoreductase
LLVNIVAFHAFLEPAGLAIPLVLLALELYLAFAYWNAYRPMLRANVRPF